jgi:hypothetical protein
MPTSLHRPTSIHFSGYQTRAWIPSMQVGLYSGQPTPQGAQLGFVLDCKGLNQTSARCDSSGCECKTGPIPMTRDACISRFDMANWQWQQLPDSHLWGEYLTYETWKGSDKVNQASEAFFFSPNPTQPSDPVLKLVGSIPINSLTSVVGMTATFNTDEKDAIRLLQ